MPAASENSEVPIQAPAIPVGSPKPRAANGRTKIMTMAHSTTVVIVTAVSSFFAPTAPATAIAADTPP